MDASERMGSMQSGPTKTLLPVATFHSSVVGSDPLPAERRKDEPRGSLAGGRCRG